MVRVAAKVPGRNGLKWRDGRPRWEPSAVNRAAGIKGRDLKDGERWLAYGEAFDAAAARHLWAGLIRRALAGEHEIHAALKTSLERLSPPKTDADRLRRTMIADLVKKAAEVVGTPPPAPIALATLSTVHTVADMIDGYFANPPLKPDPKGGPSRPPASETLKSYQTQAKKLRDKFGDRDIYALHKGDMRKWYEEIIARHSLSTANQAMAATSAFFTWASWQSPPWRLDNPTHKIGRTAPVGRIVFWTMAEETAFTAWCDASGFADIADAVVLMAWTGASSVDACKANIDDLGGEAWRHVRQKTERRGGEALPGLLPAVKARVERRRRDTVRTLDNAFLIDPETGKRHTTASLRKRFTAARYGCLVARAAPVELADKRLQDLRDTCLSRLAWAGVSLDRIPSWSGHSRSSAQEILKAHYLALRETEAVADAETLAAWAAKEGVKL